MLIDGCSARHMILMHITAASKNHDQAELTGCARSSPSINRRCYTMSKLRREYDWRYTKDIKVKDQPFLVFTELCGQHVRAGFRLQKRGMKTLRPDVSLLKYDRSKLKSRPNPKSLGQTHRG